MLVDTTADPVNPEKAIRYFRRKLKLTDDEWQELEDQNNDLAFRLAGIADIDVIEQTWSALDKAIEQGTDFEEFKSDVAQSLTDAWGGSVANPGHRLETIFRTNTITAYQAGHHEQAMRQKDDRMYGMLDVVEDDATSEICSDLDDQIGGVALPIDDPALQAAWPPNHFNCRSNIITLTEDEANEQGIGEGPDPDDLDIDEDFRGPPGADGLPDPEEYGELEDIVRDFLDE